MKTNIKKMSQFSSKFPKTINEAINFNEADEMDYMPMDDEMDMPAEEMPEEMPKRNYHRLGRCGGRHCRSRRRHE